MDPSRLIPGDATLIENIVNYFKAKGIFDEFRHECLADVDTKSSCQNLNQRIDGYTSKFLANETWNQDLNKNELRNKLRRHIDESGMLAVGADHVVEQVINPKIHAFFLPKVIEVVHQYLREQKELFSKKTEIATTDSSCLEKPLSDTSDGSMLKAKTTMSDPIADILSFSYSKTKHTLGSGHGKSDAGQQKHTDHKKKKDDELAFDKRKEENSSDKKKDEIGYDKNREKEKQSDSIEFSSEIASVVTNDIKLYEKEKIKKEIKLEESEVGLEVTKKVIKEEIKCEKKKNDDMKNQNIEIAITPEENKPSLSTLVKSTASVKKEFDKSKHKSKNIDSSKVLSSKEGKKFKKDISHKSYDKYSKSKHSKLSKESSSLTKGISLLKPASKDEKHGFISKSKCDSSSVKTYDSSGRKASKSDSIKKDSIDSKHKKYSEKLEKSKIPKSGDFKKERSQPDSGSVDKVLKNTQYSSSQDSSQGSDQEKVISNTSSEKHKHFSKHVKKESFDRKSDKNFKISSDKKRVKDSDENFAKKLKFGKSLKTENFKEVSVLGEAAKIGSRSNSFGSSSSLSSGSNASKDVLTSNSEEMFEKSNKKKKDIKEKDRCHSPNPLPPPPPPPPPPTGSIALKLTSSEMSSLDDIQSSSESENSSSEENSEEFSTSDSESDSKTALLEALEKYVPNSSVDDIEDFYDIFLYSSSSSEFEGYGDSPEKRKPVENQCNSDVSISSVHTSDLSSYDDELSTDEFTSIEGIDAQRKKRFTLKEAQQLLQNRVHCKLICENKSEAFQNEHEENARHASLTRTSDQGTSYYLSSEDESSPSENKRLLRRERRLNPRYASNEYTSIFNATKESFITKQSPLKRNEPSLLGESRYKRRDFSIERNEGAERRISQKSNVSKTFEEEKFQTGSEEPKFRKRVLEIKLKRNSTLEKNSEILSMECMEEPTVHVNSKIPAVQGSSVETTVQQSLESVLPDKFKQAVLHGHSEGTESGNAFEVSKEHLDNLLDIKGFIFISDPLDDDTLKDSGQSVAFSKNNSILEKEKLSQGNKEDNIVAEQVTLQMKMNSQSKPKLNLYPVKRKLIMNESPPTKRPCSRSSVDSSGSESAANENKPFNTDKQSSTDEKLLRLNNDLKGSDLTGPLKTDLFCIQRSHNNGDVLGQRELILNSHGKSVCASEKISKESDTNKELNAL